MHIINKVIIWIWISKYSYSHMQFKEWNMIITNYQYDIIRISLEN